jgi:hypothetical protein
MQQTNELVKQNIIEFLQFNGYSKTAEKLAKETPKPISSGLKHDPLPKIISFFDGPSVRDGRNKRLNREF